MSNINPGNKFKQIRDTHQSMGVLNLQEADYLIRIDAAQAAVMNRVEMPDRLAQNLILFVRQNHGALAKKRREKEFKALTDDEVTDLEALINEAFDDLA